MIGRVAGMSCPVCGMAVDKANAYHLENGQDLLFCSSDHVNTFASMPVRRLDLHVHVHLRFTELIVGDNFSFCYSVHVF